MTKLNKLKTHPKNPVYQFNCSLWYFSRKIKKLTECAKKNEYEYGRSIRNLLCVLYSATFSFSSDFSRTVEVDRTRAYQQIFWSFKYCVSICFLFIAFLKFMIAKWITHLRKYCAGFLQENASS